MADLTVVTGAGGFIGGHLVASLLADGKQVRGVDHKPAGEWHQRPEGADYVELELTEGEACREAVDGASRVFNLAADMGGMGFIANNKALCMLSVLVNTHLLEACREAGVERYFFSSSACVYATEKQDDPDVTALREDDAYPAMPEDGYGWEKLFGERMCRHFREDFGLETRVARYHNIYGPLGSFERGREKAPAAICRKVAEAELSGRHEIEVWGDGEQTRSFTYIDDCMHGTKAIMDSEVNEPINLGSSELVTINELIDKVERIAGIEVERRYDTSMPQGVRGRNSDNTMILERLGWQPSISLDQGLAATYSWIHGQLAART
jgi:GDP-D-mannose 3',5'-epimerase